MVNFDKLYGILIYILKYFTKEHKLSYLDPCNFTTNSVNARAPLFKSKNTKIFIFVELSVSEKLEEV